MHGPGVTPFYKVGRPAAATQELLQLLRLDPGKHGRVTDLVPIQVKDRQHYPICDGVEKLVGLPRRGQGACFRLAVTDNAGDDQPGIVKSSSKGMTERIPQFPALVDRTWRRRRHMAGDTAR